MKKQKQKQKTENKKQNKHIASFAFLSEGIPTIVQNW